MTQNETKGKMDLRNMLCLGPDYGGAPETSLWEKGKKLQSFCWEESRKGTGPTVRGICPGSTLSPLHPVHLACSLLMESLGMGCQSHTA